MLVADTHDDHDLFFNDNTNIADVYDGYKKMFDVRSADLKSQQDEANPNPEIDSCIQKMEAGQKALDVQYDSYLDWYGLKDITKNDAKVLDRRYDEMAKMLNSVRLDDATAKQVVEQSPGGEEITLGELLSKFEFCDAEGNIEPQFKDKDGKETAVWSEGATVIEGSKLDKTIAMAKQLYVQNHLATNEPLTQEDMGKVLKEFVPQALYALNVKSLAQQNILERLDQYKDKETIKSNIAEFVREVSSDNHSTVITDNIFQSTTNSIVNHAHAYRGVLAKQLGVKHDDNVDDTPVLNKVCNHVKPLDPRANARNEESVTKDVWRSYFSETFQGMTSAAIGTARVKGAMLTSVAMAHAVTGIATAQLMLGASAIIPAAMTIKSIVAWRKKQKAQGKPTGFKEFIKDEDMRYTLLTTTLTEIAVGCMFIPTPGARVAGVAIGLSALGLGAGRIAKNEYEKLCKAGINRWAALGAAVVSAGAIVGTSVLVNKGMTNLFQNYFGETTTTKHHEGSAEESHTELRETQKLIDRAKTTLSSFYNGNPEGLEHDLAQVREQLHAMGRDDISPEVFLRDACDAGMNTGTNTVNHVDGGGVVNTNGNNLIMTDAWAREHNVDLNNLHALGGIKDASGNIVITNDAINGYTEVRTHVSIWNEIGSTNNQTTGERIEGHKDGYLHRQAMVDDSGRTVHAAPGKGTEFNTYADGESGYQEVKVVDKEAVAPWDEKVPEKVNYDTPWAAGMYGIRKGGWIHKLLDRAGSLPDKFIGKKKEDIPVVDEPPVVNVPPAVNEPPAVEGGQPVEVTTTPEQEDKFELKDKGLLIDEYQIVYGVKPDEDAYAAYLARVEKEKAEDKKYSNESMDEYLLARRAAFDKVVVDKTPDTLLKADYIKHETPVIDDKESIDYKARGQAKIVVAARESLRQSNLTQDNYENVITLTHFSKYMEHYVVSDKQVADGSRRPDLNPTYKRKAKNPNSKSTITDLNGYLVEGKPLKDCQEEVSSRDVAQANAAIMREAERRRGKGK